MDNNITALQGLYVALGGTLADVANITTIPEMINAIATVVPSGAGASLPAVTDADNGKLLTVVDGEWAKADAPKELPDVTTADNGSVLKVVSGAWDKATS